MKEMDHIEYKSSLMIEGNITKSAKPLGPDDKGKKLIGNFLQILAKAFLFNFQLNWVTDCLGPITKC